MTTLPPDLSCWIERRFASDDRPTAITLLEGAVDHRDAPVQARLLRCAAQASRGDVAKLRYYVDLLKIDYRDVIVAGEYGVEGGDLVRVRNLSLPMADE
jgi:hypothetical protein